MINKIIFVPLFFLAAACAEKQPGKQELFDPASHDARLVKSINNCKILNEKGTLQINFMAGKGNPVIGIYPEEGLWDASDYRFVRCQVENPNNRPLTVELGFGDYDLTLGATIVPAFGERALKAVIYRTEHPAYIDSVFPVMHGKPDGVLRGWMASTCDSIEYIRLIFPEAQPGDSVRIGKIWLEGAYELLSEEALKDRFYPFVDEFGQYMYANWPGKIQSVDDLKAYDEKEKVDLADFGNMPAWNKYGGWDSGPQLKATGRFRVEKHDGKWWFIDPEGKLFWSHGIDCVEFGTQTRTRISGREHYFNYLPFEESDEARLYTSTGPPGNETWWLSFHALNLFRKYGESWKEVSGERIHERLRGWGMNTIANWSDPAIYLKRETPYVLTAYTRKTGLIADPYATGFKEDLEASLRSRKEELNDPWCLGVFVDNELKWGVKWAAKIPEQIQTAPEDQPAKQAFRDRMKVKYESIDKLNIAWGSSFSDWEGLLQNTAVISGAEGDMRDFMKQFTSLYYSQCRDAVKKIDPEMLYLGCRMDFHLYPEDTSLNYIIKIAAEYCDVVSFNRYRYTCSELVPPDDGDYPIIIGEFHFGTLETGLLQPGLRYAADQQERAEFYRHYVNSGLQNPYIVGTHWFQLVDQAVTGRPDGENYQAGFLTTGDLPQEEIIAKSRELGQQMYEIRSNDY
jgi:hypothetical protein